MNIGFIETYDIESPEYDQIDLYNPLLPKLCFGYVKNYFDGFLYVYKDRNIGFDDLLQFFIKAKSLALSGYFFSISSSIKRLTDVPLLSAIVLRYPCDFPFHHQGWKTINQGFSWWSW